jgi:hypothetical protein
MRRTFHSQVYTKGQKDLGIVIHGDKIESIESFDKKTLEEYMDLMGSYSLFELHSDDESLSENLKKVSTAHIDYTFYIPTDGDHSKEDASQDALWKSMDYIITGAPFLVRDGVANKDESFKDSKLRQISSMMGMNVARSALCVLRDNNWLLVTLESASPEQLCSSLERIGCLHAINLDGGPSARIRLKDGTSSDSSDRKISDALLMFPRERAE